MTREELEEQLGMVQALQKDPTFVKLGAMLQEQADALQQDILFSPVRGLDDAIQSERKKGELSGILRSAETLQAWEEQIKFDLKRVEDKEE